MQLDDVHAQNCQCLDQLLSVDVAPRQQVVDHIFVVGVYPVRAALQQATQLRDLAVPLFLPVDLALGGPVALLLAFLLLALEG